MATAMLEPSQRLRDLFSKGSQVDINHNVPIRRYYRSCQELMRMASVYLEEKDLENSYILYAKYIVLSVEKLKTHPDFNNVPAAEKAANRKALKLAFEKAEKLKPLLKNKYEEAYKKYIQQQERATELARLEKEKRRQEEENIKAEIENQKRQLEKEQMDAFLNERRRKELEMERLEIEAKYSDQAAKDTKQPLLPIDFALPPIFCNSSSSTENTSAIATAGVAVQIPPKAATTKPAINRSLKPTLITDNSTVSNVHNVDQLSTSFTASLTISKNKYGLRTIVSPSELSSKFMKCAEANTCKNIETCGVLFGKLANEEFVITHILIPHQIGAPDSCDTTREEDMWDFQDQYNGICLGWIHSHPSQTAFLSSVDLHTHYPYQCLMPESVAIVCSGKFNEVGYFMLTPDHGMNVIGNCRKIGFHPHPSNPALFEACDHVKVSSSQKVEIVDWRKK